MSEPWLPWVELRPSRLQRRLIALALLVSAATVVLLGYAAWRAPTTSGIAAAAVAAGSLLAAFFVVARSRERPPSLRVDADGRIATRRGEDTAPAQAVFVSPWLIALRAGSRRFVPVWRDALAEPGYRRLAAASRWRAPRIRELNGISDGIA